MGGERFDHRGAGATTTQTRALEGAERMLCPLALDRGGHQPMVATGRDRSAGRMARSRPTGSESR